jgi:hypothetical protein
MLQREAVADSRAVATDACTRGAVEPARSVGRCARSPRFLGSRSLFASLDQLVAPRTHTELLR